VPIALIHCVSDDGFSVGEDVVSKKQIAAKIKELAVKVRSPQTNVRL
jgi:hypothetical protein